MAALADKLGRLIGALHVRYSVLSLAANDFKDITRGPGLLPRLLRWPEANSTAAYAGIAPRSQRGAMPVTGGHE
jgi:hypothetical protein